ncbi:hypothetical protein K432DRAFT_298365, partial [Lepidopterella palustris CBS 459.81]
GTKNINALHHLNGLIEVTGRYGDAESSTMEVLPWMQGHEVLGSNSPQVLGL